MEKKKQVVMCACNNKEMFQVQQAVKKADPDSFLIVLESMRFMERDLRWYRLGRKETDRIFMW